jgi:hypothetical protein
MNMTVTPRLPELKSSRKTEGKRNKGTVDKLGNNRALA